MAGDKYLFTNAGVMTEKAAVQSSAGAGNAGNLPALDANGKLDQSMMPAGVVADTASILASENLAANDLVNVYNNAGAAGCRKADASAAGKYAHGFVLAAVTSGQAATVYFEGPNAGLTGLTPGVQFLSATVPGKTQAAAPTGTGQVQQVCGFAFSTIAFDFQSEPPIVLA